jgi:acyl-CoA synthetase (NDP forming)
MSGDQSRVRAVFEEVKTAGRTVLTAPEAREVCEAYGLPVPKEGLARSIEEAARVARDIGFPVAVKIVSPDIVHKTEAGGVQLGLSNTRQVRQAYRTITANAWHYQSDAHITGVQVQQMVTDGSEVIVGMIRDPAFGPVVMFGLGGCSSKRCKIRLSSGADDTDRGAPDARRRPGCGGSARRSRVTGGQSGGASGLDCQGVPIGGRFP